MTTRSAAKIRLKKEAEDLRSLSEGLCNDLRDVDEGNVRYLVEKTKALKTIVETYKIIHVLEQLYYKIDSSTIKKVKKDTIVHDLRQTSMDL